MFIMEDTAVVALLDSVLKNVLVQLALGRSLRWKKVLHRPKQVQGCSSGESFGRSIVVRRTAGMCSCQEPGGLALGYSRNSVLSELGPFGEDSVSNSVGPSA